MDKNVFTAQNTFTRLLLSIQQRTDLFPAMTVVILELRVRAFSSGRQRFAFVYVYSHTCDPVLE
jgi:hypothetical protein